MADQLTIQFTPKERKAIAATVGAMRIQHNRDGIWEPWWLKFVEWAESELASEYRDNDAKP